MSLLLAWLLSLYSLGTDSQRVTWSFPNVLSGSFARLSLCKCHRESFHLCEQTLGVVSVKDLVLRVRFLLLSQFRGCLPSCRFFLFPRDRHSRNICCKLGFVEILVSFLFPQTCRKIEVPQRNQVTLSSGREQRQGLGLGFSNPGQTLACWPGAESMP